ncbi:tetratricopeptide repeat protein [Paenactinomyces guangxiensis]|uniref:Helix-turn-helix transcriptional regulator n=1 Tax=Paenactinomyces guangxiensis TaxID=1490290 RepID=A0A7W1WN53_9BACL|nr:helix-turn-helix transcriptional regulator [Paenactinomyces guangxiensis]MBA4492983.1 helix-turn-helix transcriptional regulator [Paenactinomyces guangxiensis]MBH8590168.1 helix-turn-helix transcriptional regulator [Paenactinomyces guangxiensis]
MKDLDFIQLGKILRRKRKEQGLRLEDLADDQISPSTISSIERGRSNVNEEKVKHLCGKLQIDMMQFPDLIQEEKQRLEKKTKQINCIETAIDLISPDKGLEKLRQLDADTTERFAATIEYLKARCYFHKQNYTKAQNHFWETIRIVDETPELVKTNLKAASLRDLARITFYDKGDLWQALKYTDEGIKAFVEKGDRPVIYYYLLVNKAMYLDKMKRNEEAIEILKELWKNLHQITSLKVIINMFELRASLLNDSQMYKEAMEYAMMGIMIARENKIPDRALELLTLLGEIHMNIQDLETAENCFLMAVELKNRIKKHQQYLLITTYTKIARLHIKQKRYKEAKKFLDEAITISKTKEAVDSLRNNEVLTAMGDYFLAIREHSEAAVWYKQSRKMAEEHGYCPLLKEILLKLLKCLEQTDQEEFQKCTFDLYRFEIEAEKHKEKLKNEIKMKNELV